MRLMSGPSSEKSSSPVQQLADDLARCGSIMGKVSAVGSEKLRVAIVYRESSSWAAQASFLQMFARSFANVADECGIEPGILSSRNERGESSVPATLPGQRWFQLPAKGGRTSMELTAEFHGLHVIIDLFGTPAPVAGVGKITWIADFQHHRLPHFFSEKERAERDAAFSERTKAAEIILLSSHAAKADCDEFLPEASTRVRVLPFPSSLVFNPLPLENPADIVRRYHLPEKFVLVANQYWAHKNHAVVLDALAQLAGEGLRIGASFTGLPSDYRDPSNTPTSKMLQGIAERGLAGQVVPLGSVPFSHLIQLMRSAAVVIQPSRFEGWSTVVQDIKALGRPLACSALSVHREQAPTALGFFDCDRPDELASLLRAHWATLSAGPDLSQENASLATERDFARSHGHRLAEICREAFHLAQASAKA